MCVRVGVFCVSIVTCVCRSSYVFVGFLCVHAFVYVCVACLCVCLSMVVCGCVHAWICFKLFAYMRVL